MSEPSTWTPHLRPRLARLRLSPTREAEIIEELSQHLDLRFEELRRHGNSESEARNLAIAELLDPDALARYMQPLRQAHAQPPLTPGMPRRVGLSSLWQDLRYAIRMLGKDRGFTAAAVVTLALGIGANSAIFALVDATLLRPLPLADAERLVVVWERSATTPKGRVALANLVDWNVRTTAFEAIGGFHTTVGSMVLVTPDGTADTVPRQWVTAGIFDALGVKPVAGRTFVPDDARERRQVVVLSEAFWRSRFNADPTVIGRVFQLDAQPWTVIGVVPEEAQLIGRTSMWALRGMPGPASSDGRSAFILQTIGRMKPGVSIDAASADLAAVAEGLAREFPKTNTGRSVALEPLRDAVIGSELRRTSVLFLAVVGFVLLICCANVANLLLARATARRRELAIRSALGADRPRIVRQLLTESLVLSTIGALLGLGLGAVMLTIAPATIPEDLLPSALALTLNVRVVTFCVTAALLVGVVFGLAPAWQATGLAAATTLASESRTVSGRGRLRELLVAGEVAAAVLLLFGAGLLLRTLIKVETVDPGYGAESVLTMIVDPPFSLEESLKFYDAIEQEVRRLPGVRDVGWATTLPMGRSYLGTVFFEIVGDPAPPESQRPAADIQIVSSTYFRALDLPIVAGRGFDERDTRKTVPVCMVNEAFVRRHLPGRSPIGLRVAMRQTIAPGSDPLIREIVGVVRQVKGRPDETEDLLQIYAPVTQLMTGDIFMLVRPASGSAEALAAPVRAAFGRIDRDHRVSVRSVMTLEEVAAEATARHRFRATLVAAFAALALALAMVGLFGILAYSVQQRVREFGVRRALGATTADVLRLVAGSAARVTIIGVLVGLTASLWLGRVLTTMLFGVQPTDPVTFVAVTIVLALTALFAAASPAWRATRVDPAVALRGE